MAYSEAGSSNEAAPASRCEDEVVLSFRRSDTRLVFTSFLYRDLVDAGVRVFRDDEELRVGEEFPPDFLRAISDSRLYIPIFSRGYASSSWCLRKLALMEKTVSKSNGQKTILPIYYDVEPRDVGLETSLYRDALQKHESKFPNEVEAWKKALRETGALKGFECPSDGRILWSIPSLVEKVLEKLGIKQEVPPHLVGLDDQIRDLNELLDVRRPNARLIVIYGIGGIGKTTIAKVMFNRLYFDFKRSCSFLEDIRESSLTKRGMVQLQRKLCCDVGFRFAEEVRDIEQGLRRIGEILRTRKVLVVLDDVAEKQHIENLIGDYSLHPRSCVIITTRDKSVLQYERFKGDILEYEIPKMDDALALQLFCRHAFDRDFPPNDYSKLSSEIVSTTGQLPLAIEVTGSFLKGKDRACWEDKLVKLRNEPEKEIQKKLLISYDGLDNNEKQIFLDIACFFFNEKKTDAIWMWDSCQLDPTIGIKVLTEKCLIKVLDNGKFWMHDQLIALGKQIVREGNLGDLEKQSRLWITEEALEIIRTKERKAKVQALEIDELDDSIEITNVELGRLPHLRLLKLGNGTFVGDFVRYRSELRWISWRSPHHDFMADNLRLGHLVVFKLDKNGFTDDSKVWDLIKTAPNLKVLSLTECNGITTIPNLCKCLLLERLTLRYCNRLKRIERFIEDLPSLIELEIEGCMSLAYLPEEVGALVKLERFSLSGCCGLSELPSSIGSLSSLIELDLSSTGIAKLPDSIQGLLKLESFLLRDTRLREIPNSIEKVKSLRVLRFSAHGCSSLEHVWQLPSGIGMLKNLEELDLSGRAEMKGEIPAGIGELPSLKILNLRDCHGIQVLQELPTSLTSLLLQSKSLLSIPKLSNLTNLVELLLSDDSRNTSKSNLLAGCDLRGIEKLDRLKKLNLNLLNVRAPQELASLNRLEELTLCQLDLEALAWPLSFLGGLRNLSTLELHQCEVKGLLLGNLPGLAKLTVDGCNQLERLFIRLNLRNLRQVWVSYCPKLVEIQLKGNSKLLKSLRIYGAESLMTIDGLSDLKRLEELIIQRCGVLTNVEGLQELESLNSLVIKECMSLKSLIDASNTKIPDDCLVEIEGCGDFIKQGTAPLKRYKEEILLDTSNKITEKMKDEAREGAADVETSESEEKLADLLEIEADDKSEEKKKDEARLQAADVENSDKNFAVASGQKNMEDLKDEVRQQAADRETSHRNYTIAAVQNIDKIDDRVKQIIDLLEMETNDEVRIVGIYGIDGIGKTTLAKAVYNRISSCFDSCSFLTEVEETTIQPLQTKLIRDILERDREDSFFDEKIDLVQDIFRGLKVLIVVDDVKEQSHLYSIVGEKEQPRFGPGSRIIVTSENREILKDYDPEKACTYTVNALDNGQVFELFCKHAFRMQSSLPDYDGLANCIVNATDKQPLSVEVVGSFLRGKSIQEWEKMEKSMKQFMMKSRKTLVGLEEILDICYKELDQQQKDIFLDIASFISSVDARIASYMWPNYSSSGCILMPLAKIGENNELQMHSSPRRLGKRILDPEGSGDPVGRKFYIQERGPKAVSLEKGMENVEPLFVHFTAEDFRNMPDIRFLKLENAKVSGNFEGAFASLRWLCWQRFPVEFDAFNFVLGELVILDLSWSKVTECWGGWSIIKMEKLKVLNLTGCSDLLFTPDFSGYKDLEILILERCSRLVKLDPSIGRLKRLVSLNLKFCSQLNGLPVELGRMTAMKELFIDGTSVQQIPISIGNLKQLKILSGWKCFSLTHLPSSISYLPALSELSLDGAKITELPSSLGQLLQLRQLSLKDCRYLEELPDSIGEMRSLEGLDISATNISELPNSIRNLDSLKVLKMDYSFIQAFPGEIGNLTSLEELNASWCRSLKGAIPRDIKELHNLKSLILGHSGISSLPFEISTITGLQTLDLLQCNEIEVLPELPPSLISLRVSSKRMKVIPLLKGLKEMEEIYLSDEDLKERQPLSEQPTPESNVKHPLSMWFSRFWNLQLFQTQRIDKQSFLISFPKLRKLELSLSQIIKLKFELTDIPQLKTLTLSGLSLKEVSALPKTLSVFKLYHSAIKEIEGLEGLKALKRLDISDCKIQNLKGIDQLTSLRSLILCDCDDLSLPDLSNLVSLKVLEIRRCKMIHQIKEIEGLKALKRLDISDCKIQNLEGIDQLTSLRSLNLSDCDELSLPDLSNLVKLKVLEIRRCKMIQQIEGLEKIASLEKLNISECPAENSEQVKNALKLVMARSVIT